MFLNAFVTRSSINSYNKLLKSDNVTKSVKGMVCSRKSTVFRKGQGLLFFLENLFRSWMMMGEKFVPNQLGNMLFKSTETAISSLIAQRAQSLGTMGMRNLQDIS